MTTFSLEDALDDLDSLETHRNEVAVIVRQRGESEMIELVRSLASQKNNLAVRKLINLSKILLIAIRFGDLPVSENSRLQFVQTAGTLYALWEVFHIPIEEWENVAYAANDLILEFLQGVSPSVRDLPSYPQWCTLLNTVEERLCRDPRWQSHFEKYAREMGS